MPPFGFEKKLIIVKNSGLFKRHKTDDEEREEDVKVQNKMENILAKYIEENIDLIKKSVVLVFVETTVIKNKLQKAIQEYGTVLEFKRLKPAQLSEMIRKICAQYKVNIDVQTANLFIDICGLNMQNLINEIRKLIEYVGPNGTITEAEINLLSIKDFDSVIFDLTDNLGKKNIKKALEILHELIYNKEPIQKILITLYGHFKKLYITILAKKYNKNLAESLNLKPNQMFLTTKYSMQARYFKEEELLNILKQLINLDYNAKKGLIDINIGLDTVLCTYCS